MYIWMKEAGNIIIYKMIPDQEKIKNYREEVLDSNPLIIKTIISNSMDAIKYIENSKNLRNSEIVFDTQNLYDRGIWSRYENNDISVEEIKENYLNGLYDNKKTIRVYNDDLKAINCFCYLLLTKKANLKNPYLTAYKLDDIIELPLNLYLLHLLLQGNFGAIINNDITEILKLCDFEYIRKIKFNDIIDILNVGLLPGNLLMLENSSDIGSKILRKARVR